MSIYKFLALMHELTQSPKPNWESLLGEEVHKLLDPKFSEYKAVENKWVFDPKYDLLFTVLASIHFADSDLLASFDKAIENIKELEV